MKASVSLPKLFFFNFALGLFLIFFNCKALAANASIVADPSTGNYTTGDNFNVDVRIDGGGLPFNAAKSTVSVSPTMRLNGLVIGNCNFSFVRTPSTSNPSFAGVILGGYSNGCTVYTLSLSPLGQGLGYLSFSSSEIKKYKTAEELLNSTTDGRYVFSGNPKLGSVSPTPTQPPTNEGGINYYDVTYFPESIDNTQVTLDPDTDGERTQSITSSSEETAVTFSKVSEGVHALLTSKNGKELSSQVINVEGGNKNIIFGKSPKQKIPTWAWITGLALTVITSMVVVIFIYRERKKA